MKNKYKNIDKKIELETLRELINKEVHQIQKDKPSKDEMILRYERLLDTTSQVLESYSFEKKYCNNCGSQRCEGINSKWFNGCEYKKELVGSDEE